MKFHGWIDLIKGKCSAQESLTLACLIFELVPFVVFHTWILSGACPSFTTWGKTGVSCDNFPLLYEFVPSWVTSWLIFVDIDGSGSDIEGSSDTIHIKDIDLEGSAVVDVYSGSGSGMEDDTVHGDPPYQHTPNRPGGHRPGGHQPGGHRPGGHQPGRHRPRPRPQTTHDITFVDPTKRPTYTFSKPKDTESGASSITTSVLLVTFTTAMLRWIL